MKKINKNNCAITRLWPSVEDMKKHLFIDLNKQEVVNLFTGNKLTPFLVEKNRPFDKRHYAIGYYNSKNKKYSILSLHRLFFYWHNGFLPRLVDHKDRNPKNNKIDNLRELNDSENTRNSSKKKNTSSKYKGVSFYKKIKKWRSQLSINGKYIHLGYFHNEDDAGQAYNDKIRELGLEGICPLNDTPQERARKINLFNEEKLSYS
jgi:hypothetical protein